MVTLEELKGIRTDAKRAVTRSSRRLHHGSQMEMDSVPEMVQHLDAAYCDFMDIAADYRELCSEKKAGNDDLIVNGMDLDQYESDVKKTYTGAIEAYRSKCAKTSCKNSTKGVTHNESHSMMAIKKRDIPKFSGERKDWPEFKSVWKKLVEPSVCNNTALATELKLSCKGGKAYPEICNISAGFDDAYDKMWDALCMHYDNITLAVSSALDEVRHFRSVSEEDYDGVVKLIRQIDCIYQQLHVLDQVEMVSNREVSAMVSHFPPLLRKDWAEFYFKLDTPKQLRPFGSLQDFLAQKLKIAKHMADTHTAVRSSKPTVHKSGNYGVKTESPCCIHDNAKHDTESCTQFISMSISERKNKLVKAGRCFRCFGPHRRATCKESTPCENCNRTTHHTLMCNPSFGNDRVETVSSRAISKTNAATTIASALSGKDGRNDKSTNESVKNHAARNGLGLTLYAIYHTPVASSSQKAVIFCDDGSDATFISEAGVRKLKARFLEKTSVEMTTLNGTQTIASSLYEIIIVTNNGKKVPIVALSLPQITGPVSMLNEAVVSCIFPDFDISTIQRPAGEVDLLLGGDYFGLHPKHEVASDGKNLSMMQGELGICVQGSHPELLESTKKDQNVGHSVRFVTSNRVSLDVSHSELSAIGSSSIDSKTNLDCADQSAKVAVSSCSVHANEDLNNFILGENLATEVNPKCGGCKCGKCPIIGHTYSFKEEQELELVNSRLHYDCNHNRWIAGYPWIADPNLLPDNYASAYATLKSMEHRLRLDPKWASKYSEQVYDMETRSVARKLEKEELETWTGPVFYLSHLAVEQPKSSTTPIRLVFNSSQVYRGVSLNSFLAKGPDSFKNNLLGMLLRFREEAVVLVGDIRKMYNSVFLDELEQHTHRFLWRDLENRPPDIWCITRVNMGDKPAGTISIEAKDRTAEKFRHLNSQAADLIIHSSYVDDIVESVGSFQEALLLSKDADLILSKGGFKTKSWKFGGEGVSKACNEIQQVLGISWVASSDMIVFKASLNFSPKRRNIYTGPELLSSQVPVDIPDILTRRMVLQQVMKIFDPYGFLAPFVIIAKKNLRETWLRGLGWDDALPKELHLVWTTFFTQLFEVEELEFERCLRPKNAIGNPSLILFSDGSEVAYGCAAYVRWTLADGSVWCRLIFAKCRIAPVSRISIPQMELNGAVMSKRCRKIIESECRYTFEEVFHFVDSLTVLGMIKKLSTRFHVYEGVRIGEIQAATDGDMSSWGWISSEDNIADWATRGKTPSELGPNSKWQRGPDFLYKPFDQWNAEFCSSTEEVLPGEKTVKVKSHAASLSGSSALRCSSFRTLRWAYARVINVFRTHSFRGGIRSRVTPALLRAGEDFLIRDAQSCWTEQDVRSQFRTLLPVKQGDFWMIGLRISHNSPLTPENKAHILLPSNHPVTRLCMREAHVDSGHKGRDATVAKFRSKYWTSHATKLGKSVCGKCQLCKLIKAKYMEQIMGQVPAERLTPSPPFTYVMVDLFGPYSVRGEVQKRTTGKAWGVIFADLCSRAVHIEVAFGYDTKSFLLCLSRFTAIRGWPAVIYSDPGSQLVGASKEVIKAWDAFDKDVLTMHGTEHGLEWRFGPADSPWHQGAVESLVKIAKRALDMSMGASKLSIPEILSVFSQTADLLNERPIGIIPGPDSPLSILTPNSLLIGRSTSRNPGGYAASQSLYSQLMVVQRVVKQFWEHWTLLYAPSLVRQSKWKAEHRDLSVGDVVIVAESGLRKGEYRLARVSKVFPSSDGKVRRVKIAYKNFRVGESLHQYTGVSDTEVERAVQKLALLVPLKD